MSESNDVEKRRSVVTSLPSDYSDVQPRNYDPDFISNISNQMQVPDSIPAVNGGTGDGLFNSRQSGGWNVDMKAQHMNVPERIMLAGGGQHIGGRPELASLNFDNLPRGGYPEAVGLQTPPRVLTLEEQFHFEEEEEDEEKRVEATPKRVPNGTVALPEPYTPGMSASDSLLFNEEDEAAQLHKQVAKLTRRITAIEKEQSTQASREMMLYTAAFGYFMLKVVWWFFRSK